MMMMMMMMVFDDEHDIHDIHDDDHDIYDDPTCIQQHLLHEQQIKLSRDPSSIECCLSRCFIFISFQFSFLSCFYFPRFFFLVEKTNRMKLGCLCSLTKSDIVNVSLMV